MANKKSKFVVVGKRGRKSPDGTKLGTTVTLADKTSGETHTKTLLNPHGKGRKYAKELREGIGYTNDGQIKKDDAGKVRKLTKQQRAYRSGYLDARKDDAKAWKAKNNRP